MWKNMFITSILLSILASALSEELFGEDSLDLENLKITDILKKLTLPSADEIRHILSSEDNTTKLPDSPKLKFILHAIEYWRNTLQDSMENETAGSTNNMTQVRFHLRDDFLDNDNTAYSHLSKKVYNTNTRKVNPLYNIYNSKTHKVNPRYAEPVRDFPSANENTRNDNDRSLPLPYIYVKNFYFTDNLYAGVPSLDLREKH